MKRTSPLRVSGVSSSDPFDNLSKDQLTYIGAIAMLYNYVEARLDEICGAGLHIPIRDEEVLSRINGIDGKIELIKLCAKHVGFDEQELSDLCDTLGKNGFQGLKSWRDAVVHARMFDISSSVGRIVERRGRLADVLLSLDALKGLYHRLDWMRSEFWELLKIMQRKSRISRGAIDDQRKERFEAENLASFALFREYRTRRLSLPPMPEFPEDTLDVGPLLRKSGPQGE